MALQWVKSGSSCVGWEGGEGGGCEGRRGEGREGGRVLRVAMWVEHCTAGVSHSVSVEVCLATCGRCSLLKCDTVLGAVWMHPTAQHVLMQTVLPAAAHLTHLTQMLNPA
jgi:hypothetical protein